MMAEGVKLFWQIVEALRKRKEDLEGKIARLEEANIKMGKYGKQIDLNWVNDIIKKDTLQKNLSYKKRKKP